MSATSTPRGIVPRRTGRSFTPRSSEDSGWFTPRTLGDGSRSCSYTAAAEKPRASLTLGGAEGGRIGEVTLRAADGTTKESLVLEDTRAIPNSNPSVGGLCSLSATESDGASSDQNGEEPWASPSDDASKPSES